jgi:hypothetical protein
MMELEHLLLGGFDNMSAPPRSSVTLPRLRTATGAAASPEAPGSARRTVARIASTTVGGRQAELPAPRRISVGPGGGTILSHAVLLGRIALRGAVCARLQIALDSPRLSSHRDMALALVALMRNSGDGAAALRTMPNLSDVTDAMLLDELASRLQAVPWPRWVPPLAVNQYVGSDIAAFVGSDVPQVPTDAVTCPLLAARIVAGFRGPIFMRDRPPALTHLIAGHSPGHPSMTWELWIPVRPGRVEVAADPSVEDR